MPYPGTRINQNATPLAGANGLTGSASYYEVKFSDPSKPNGQIWTGVVSAPATAAGGPPQRWFVVWLGTANDPVDKGAAKALAESIQPWTAPPAARREPPLRAPEPSGSRRCSGGRLRLRRPRHRPGPRGSTSRLPRHRRHGPCRRPNPARDAIVAG